MYIDLKKCAWLMVERFVSALLGNYEGAVSLDPGASAASVPRRREARLRHHEFENMKGFLILGVRWRRDPYSENLDRLVYGPQLGDASCLCGLLGPYSLETPYPAC